MAMLIIFFDSFVNLGFKHVISCDFASKTKINIHKLTGRAVYQQ